MLCEYQCYEIGGPWIAENPKCPVHGTEAQRHKEIAEVQKQELEDRVSDLEEQVAWLITQVKKGG